MFTSFVYDPMKMFDLRMFDYTPADPNTNVTTDGGMTHEMKIFYEKDLIQMAEPALIHDQFATKYPIPKGGGKTIEFRMFQPLAKALTPLTEGVTPTGKKLTVDHLTATVAQYGDYVTVSDVLELTAIDPVITEATKAIASQAGRTLDTVTREVVNAGTNVLRAEHRTDRNLVTATDLISFNLLREAVTILKRQNTPKINGDYVAIVHPDVAHDIMGSEEWIDVNKYSNATNIFEGEIGKIAGIRFIENTEAKIFKQAGANSANVYSTLILGDGAYATTDVTGGGLEHIVHQKGSAGTADALNMRSTIGWKAIKTAEILIQQYMIRVETSSSMQATAVIN